MLFQRNKNLIKNTEVAIKNISKSSKEILRLRPLVLPVRVE
jgi:hypothetical protein